jgi:hypothetical protein
MTISGRQFVCKVAASLASCLTRSLRAREDSFKIVSCFCRPVAAAGTHIPRSLLPPTNETHSAGKACGNTEP